MIDRYRLYFDSDGSKKYYLNGKLHRTDGPAIIYNDGTEQWYINGKFHRTDGPAIIAIDKSEYWYKDGQRHRSDGPAVIHNENEWRWYHHDQLHRLDGPAVRTKYHTLYYIYDKQYTYDEWKIKVKEIQLLDNLQSII